MLKRRLLPTLAASALLSALPAFAETPSLSEITEAWLNDPHGQYRSESFTHWNEDGEIPTHCAACHSETGFLDWLGADDTAALSVEHPATINTVIGCASCHVSEAEALDAVPFPSGVTVDGLDTSATCTLCHQGRSSTDAVVAATDTLDPDTVSADLSFINIHYGVAAAVMQGAETRGGFQYDGASYAGAFRHVPSANSCVDCHAPHSTEVATEGCLDCHQGVDDITAIRTQHEDFDGDGRSDGGIKDEIAGMHAVLYTAIQAYASEVAGAPIGYDASAYPYFFADTDGNGTIDDGEGIYPNQYKSWTPRLLKAAYNYQVVSKDGGAWAHNPRYALQLLHDSILDLSEAVEVETGGLGRP